jgi:glyoxylase-like metal-dependent hydrolase (beta-lactamase superfamily II)
MVRLDHTVTSGTFSLDGGTWDVDNNVWVLGDDDECLVIDAPHAAAPIVELVGARRVLAIVCTHAHDDHVSVAPELAAQFDAPIRLHPDDDVLWQRSHPGVSYQPLADGEQLSVAGATVTVLHTPGHSPGSVGLRVHDLAAVFTGDTLFAGGPGATGRSYSDYPTILSSIRAQLLSLPDDTVVHTGHGGDTTIAAERDGLTVA